MQDPSHDRLQLGAVRTRYTDRTLVGDKGHGAAAALLLDLDPP